MNQIKLAAIAAWIAFVWSISLTGAAMAQATSPESTPPAQVTGLPWMTDIGETRSKNADNVTIVLVVPTGRCPACDKQEKVFVEGARDFAEVRFFKAKISLFHLPRSVVPGIYAFTPGVERPSYAQPGIEMNAEQFAQFVRDRITFAAKRQKILAELKEANEDLATKQKPFDEERRSVTEEEREDLAAEWKAVQTAEAQVRQIPPFIGGGALEHFQQAVSEAIAEFNDAAKAAGYDKRFAHINNRMKATLATELARVSAAQDALERADNSEHAAGQQISI